jgi:hypothetical protein
MKKGLLTSGLRRMDLISDIILVPAEAVRENPST